MSGNAAWTNQAHGICVGNGVLRAQKYQAHGQVVLVSKFIAVFGFLRHCDIGLFFIGTQVPLAPFIARFLLFLHGFRAHLFGHFGTDHCH